MTPTATMPSPANAEQWQQQRWHGTQRLAAPQRGMQHHAQRPLPRGAESAERARLAFERGS